MDDNEQSGGVKQCYPRHTRDGFHICIYLSILAQRLKKGLDQILGRGGSLSPP